MDFYVYSKKKIVFYSGKRINIYRINEIPMKNNLLYLLYMESSYLFTCCENNVFLGIGLFNKLNEPYFYIFLWSKGIFIFNHIIIFIHSKKLMKSAIKANDDFVIFKSNKIASKGINQIL